MKTKTLMLVLVLSAHLLFANDGKYMEAMGKNIQLVYTAQSIADLQNAVNTLERIGAAEKTKWEPFYYASFGYIMMSNKATENEKKDAFLDLAVTSLEKAKAILPNDSELISMEGFIQMLRIGIDPPARGPKFSGMAMQSFGKAMALNPENPRAIALMAQMQFGTAKFFGSSTADACGLASKAAEKFTTYKSDNPLAPQWGNEMNEGLRGQCK
jgi:hypothetical protein